MLKCHQALNCAPCLFMHLGEGTGDDFRFITSNITFPVPLGVAWLYFHISMSLYLVILFLLESSLSLFRS